MPVTIDIREDIRYQQGVEQGKTEGYQEREFEIAKRMFENGSDISFVQKVTGLPINKIEEIAHKLNRK